MPRAATVERDPALEADTAAAARAPGQFARHGGTGAPYVADPERTTKHKGSKADLIVECSRRGIALPDGKVTVAQLHELLGPRPCMVLYGRPSTLGKQIENTTNLMKWSERAVALGLFLAGQADLAPLDEGLGLLAEEQLNLDNPDARKVLDEIAVKAKNRAQAGIAAERGTHGHELTEDYDLEGDYIARIVHGEDLGLPAPVQHALVAAWEKMLQVHGFEILAVEATCVDDRWRQAGTLDRIVRLKRDLRFVTANGEIVVLPAGWVGILDIKTGRLRLDDAGFVAHWHGYAVQLASYQQSVPYDPDTDQRSEWPWTIDDRWAIIAHLDIAAALDGRATCRLVLVDLEAGRHAGDLCVAARKWEKRTDVFTLITDDLAVVVPVEGFTEGPASPTARVTAAGGAPSGPPAATFAALDATAASVERPPTDSPSVGEIAPPGLNGHAGRPAPGVQRAGEAAATSPATICEHEWKQVGRCAYCDRCGLRFQGKAPTTPEASAAIDAVMQAAAARFAAQADAQPGTVAAGGATPAAPGDEADRRQALLARYRALPHDAQAEHTRRKHAGLLGDLDAVEASLDELDPFATVDTPPAPPRESVPKIAQSFRPDEGGQADSAAVAALRRRFEALPAYDQAWVGSLVAEGRAAGVPWGAGQAHTVRRFELGRAIVALAASSYFEPWDIARGLLGSVTGREEVEQESIPLGAAIGSLDAAEAAAFALEVDEYLAPVGAA